MFLTFVYVLLKQIILTQKILPFCIYIYKKELFITALYKLLEHLLCLLHQTRLLILVPEASDSFEPNNHHSALKENTLTIGNVTDTT